MNAPSPERIAYEMLYGHSGIAFEELSPADRMGLKAATEAVIKASSDALAARLRSMITAKQTAIATAGLSHGLAPGWHEATFTAAEIEAVIGSAAPADRRAEANGQAAGPVWRVLQYTAARYGYLLDTED